MNIIWCISLVIWLVGAIWVCKGMKNLDDPFIAWILLFIGLAGMIMSV